MSNKLVPISIFLEQYIFDFLKEWVISCTIQNSINKPVLCVISPGLRILAVDGLGSGSGESVRIVRPLRARHTSGFEIVRNIGPESPRGCIDPRCSISSIPIGVVIRIIRGHAIIASSFWLSSFEGRCSVGAMGSCVYVIPHVQYRIRFVEESISGWSTNCPSGSLTRGFYVSVDSRWQIWRTLMRWSRLGLYRILRQSRLFVHWAWHGESVFAVCGPALSSLVLLECLIHSDLWVFGVNYCSSGNANVIDGWKLRLIKMKCLMRSKIKCLMRSNIMFHGIQNWSISYDPSSIFSDESKIRTFQVQNSISFG